MANKKKVLFLITKSNAGGAQRYVRDLAIELPKDTFDVVVVTGEDTQPGSGWLIQEMNRANVRVVTLSRLTRDIQNPLKELGVIVMLLKIVAKERPDILHVNSAKAGGLGTFIGRILRIKKIIFTSHGWASNEKRPFIARKIIFFFEWLTVFFSHTTIMNSRATLRHLAHLPFVTQKSQLIHLGMQPFETFSKASARDNLGVPQEGFMIGSIAELHSNKGIDVLVETNRIIPETAMYIVGDGDARKSIEHAIAQYQLLNSFHLLGSIPDAKKYLRAFDMFVLPSRTESLGYVLLEAGMAGVPVIATNVGGIPEIIEHEKTGLLVPPENPEALASAITRLHNDTDLQKKLSDNLYTKVTEQFSIERMVEKTIAVYTT